MAREPDTVLDEARPGSQRCTDRLGSGSFAVVATSCKSRCIHTAVKNETAPLSVTSQARTLAVRKVAEHYAHAMRTAIDPNQANGNAPAGHRRGRQHAHPESTHLRRADHAWFCAHAPPPTGLSLWCCARRSARYAMYMDRLVMLSDGIHNGSDSLAGGGVMG